MSRDHQTAMCSV